MIAPSSFVFLISCFVVPAALISCRRAETSSSGESPASALKSGPAALHEGVLAMTMPPEEVFKRALWRRPASDDKILHAERREWTKDSAGGAAYWQWFLAVEPGAALKSWLHEKNPFAVHPDKSAAASSVNGAPEWFPHDFSGYDVHAGGTTGRLVFLFSRDGGTLYATGSGTGFTPGVPEAAQPVPAATIATGRLPLTPPPTLSKP